MNKHYMIEPGTTPAPEKYKIVIDVKGPYLVWGVPPLRQYFIMPNAEGVSWEFVAGASFKMDKEPTALCRCGASKNKPYCDGAHLKADWDPTLTASEEPLLEGAEVFEGPSLSVSDNRPYCAYARFCDAKGGVWNLVGESEDEYARELTIREANMCPAGRLSAWDSQTQRPFEPHYEPSLGLIEDPKIGASGPLWVRGGITIARADGFVYEVRNRVTLCRCGQSDNKPYCDGTHASMRFHDGLDKLPHKE